MLARVLCSLLLLASSSALAQTQLLYAGAACGRSIQAAVDAAAAAGPGTVLIRVVADSSHNAQAIVLPHRVLILEGGYSSCTDPEPDPMVRSVISGAGGISAPVISLPPCISGCVASDALSFILRNVEVRSGEQSGVRIRRNVFGSISNSAVIGNANPSNGGGIDIAADPANPTFVPFINLFNNSSVSGNTTGANGGGIACSAATVLTSHETQFADNIAGGNGGGIYAGDDCRFTVRSAGPGGGVLRNRAVSGGGVYADSGSTVDVSVVTEATVPAAPPRLIENRALGRPGLDTLGGAAIAGRNSSLRILHGEIEQNVAENRPFAAAIAYETFAAPGALPEFAIAGNPLPSAQCRYSGLACVRIRGNFSTIPNLISQIQSCSAIGIRSDRPVIIEGAEIRGNFLVPADPADIASTSAAVCLGSLGNARPGLTLRRSLVVQNSDTSKAISFTHSSSVTNDAGVGNVSFVTSAEHGFAGTSRASIASFAPALNVTDSILMDASGEALIGPSNSAARLLALSFPGSPPLGSFTQTLAQTFVNHVFGDFSLVPGSLNLAIDSALCGSSAQQDYENELFFDDPAVTNAPGACDRGADEFTTRLLLDGFE
jgi:predicted outer membrane repeat protein